MIKKAAVIFSLALFALVLGASSFAIAEDTEGIQKEEAALETEDLLAADLPIYSESESPLVIRNMYATEVTEETASLCLELRSTKVVSYQLYLGSSADALQLDQTVTVNEKTASLMASVSGLSSYTRYYYQFRIYTASEVTVTDTWSFVTPNSYYDGTLGGSLENLTNGVDLSSWNDTVDFTKFSEQGIEFVILRAGTTYGKDRRFEEYYEKARAAGLKIGVYFYTYAMSVEDAEADAEKLLHYICGKTFDFPVYLDIENDSQAASLGRTLLTEMSIAFCEKISDAGYYPGIYANRNWFTNHLNYSTLASTYELWLAIYPADRLPNGDYSGEYGMWQYSDRGSVDGSSDVTDMDVCYKDYSQIIQNLQTSVYTFEDWDGNVLKTYYLYPGVTIYDPELTPSRDPDDVYEYTFDSWYGLTENMVAESGGGTFTAFYQTKEHKYGDWVIVSDWEWHRTCSSCGHTEVYFLQDVSCGENAYWSLVGGVLAIKGSGAMVDGTSLSDFGWYDQADQIVSVVISDGITSLGSYCFSGLKNLTTVNLSLSVQSIADHAFEGDTSLREVTIPAQTKTIADSAFQGCSSLTKISGYVGSEAESLATRLNLSFFVLTPTMVQGEKGENGVGWFFYSDGTLLVAGIGNMQEIGWKAFRDEILTVQLGAGVKSVCAGAFSDCQNLTYVVSFSDTPITIGKNAFSNCSSLSEIDLPRGSTFDRSALIGTPLIEYEND